MLQLKYMSKSNIIITIVVLLVVIGGAFYLERGSQPPADTPMDDDMTQQDKTGTSVPPATTQDELPATTSDQSDADTDDRTATVIGTSAGGHDITAYRFGDGDTHLMFVAGLHGGYDWNTIKLADRMVNWFNDNPSVIPDNVSVTVIPNLNPDGLETTVGTTSLAFSRADVADNTIPGRFNANDVDLNRNFDCNWQSQGTWRDRTVDAGSQPFSEPETQALRDYVQNNQPDAVVAYYAAAGGVYTSSCNGQVMSETTELMNTYAQASGYPAEGEFTAYEVTGDMVDWVAKQGIPGISVLLSDHQNIEWEKNKAGIQRVFDTYSQ